MDDARALSWSHVILDGKGAELLLAETGGLCAGLDAAGDTSQPPPPAPLSFREKILKTKARDRYLAELAKCGVRSLSGPKPRVGAGPLSGDCARCGEFREGACASGTNCGRVVPLCLLYRLCGSARSPCLSPPWEVAARICGERAGAEKEAGRAWSDPAQPDGGALFLPGA